MTYLISNFGAKRFLSPEGFQCLLVPCCYGIPALFIKVGMADQGLQSQFAGNHGKGSTFKRVQGRCASRQQVCQPPTHQARADYILTYIKFAN
mmetsp:Transcript_88094/g.139197  ORF Transcript_88094/g.139197 Transcript_88094/m.139197 type:complete len:93 (-) Transcript_88094:335-613(-)